MFFRKKNPIRGRMKRTEKPIAPEIREWDEIEQFPKWVKLRPCCSDGHSCGQKALKNMLKLRTTNMSRVFFFMGIMSVVLPHG